ncbi:hypothetical protein V8E54_004291 [Elaphomyces granulatus]
MTMPSIKAVILIGDQEQLPPTVVTEHSNNEGAEYPKRSLMEHLPPRPEPRAPTDLEMRGMRLLDRTTICTTSTWRESADYL